MRLSSTIEVIESDERLPIPLEWEVLDEPGLVDDLLAWIVERVRDFGRCGGSATERSSSDGAVARVIRRWEPLGLEFLEDKEGGLDGEILSELWVEGLEEEELEPWEPWDRERKDCRDFVDLVERAETREELLRDCLRTCLSDLRLDARLDMTLGNDAKGSEGDGCWTSDGAEMSEDAIGRAEGGF